MLCSKTIFSKVKHLGFGLSSTSFRNGSFRLQQFVTRPTFLKTFSATNPSLLITTAKFSRDSEMASDLAECLSAEIQAEVADDEIDQEYLDVKKIVEKNFKVSDEEGKGVVTLSRQFKSESIVITFDCQDEEEIDPSAEDMENQGKEEDDEGPEMAVGINFDITITSKDGSKMVVDCTATQDLMVNQVRYVDSGKDVTDTTLYGGPVFDQLDDKLVDAFYAYLDDRKINADLCYFICAHAGVKEQKEYVNWLNKLLNFVEK